MPMTFRSLALLALLLAPSQARSQLPEADPQTVGVNADRLAQIDAAVQTALDENRLPGCVVLVARQGKTVWRKAYGQRQLAPEPEPMTVDTLFDLASLTKPLATAMSIMVLVDQGKLALDDPAAKHLPEFAAAGKETITLRHLLTHQGGLPAANHLNEYRDGPQRAWERILATRAQAAPGERFTYSDIGFLVLGAVVERTGGMPLDEFARRRLYEPLQLKTLGFCPAEELRPRAAPTERREGKWIRGEVHDPRAWRLGGVAGHAGLFATADDLALFAQTLLNRGQWGDVRLIGEETFAAMTAPHQTPGGVRGLGWDMQSRFSSNRSSRYSERAFGHGGFTCVSLWIDPDRNLVVILLSNRVHPNGQGAVNPLAARVGAIAVEAIKE